MATHYSILAWRIPWTGEPGRLQFIGHKELNTAEASYTHTPYIEHTYQDSEIADDRNLLQTDLNQEENV